MPKAMDEFHKAKADYTASLGKLTQVIDAVGKELGELEAKKAALSTEVAMISQGLQPLRQEAEGQRREVSKAYEDARLAKIEGDKVVAEINKEISKLRQQADEAAQKAEAAYVKHMNERQAEITAIDKVLEAKKQELADFQKKWAKNFKEA